MKGGGGTRAGEGRLLRGQGTEPGGAQVRGGRSGGERGHGQTLFMARETVGCRRGGVLTVGCAGVTTGWSVAAMAGGGGQVLEAADNLLQGLDRLGGTVLVALLAKLGELLLHGL